MLILSGGQTRLHSHIKYDCPAPEVRKQIKEEPVYKSLSLFTTVTKVRKQTRRKYMRVLHVVAFGREIKFI